MPLMKNASCYREKSAKACNKRRIGKDLLRKMLILVCLCAAFASVGSASNVTKFMKNAPGFVWKTEKSKSFVFYYEARTPAARDIEKIKTNMEKERSAVEALLGATSRQKLDVFLVDSLKRMKELVGSERHAWASDTVIGATYGDDRIRRVGAHEILHCLALKLWGRPSGLWASEGLAVYSEDEWRDIPLHLLAKWLLDKGQLLPMSTLTNSDSWKTNMITYPQCGSFVKFIYERYGMAVMKDFYLKGIQKAGKQMGKTLPDLEKEWLAEVAKFDASAVQYQLQ